MTYRVRKQFLTGKLVLQQKLLDVWIDSTSPPASGRGLDGTEFEPVASFYVDRLETRIAKYEKRAAGQRKGRAAKKAPVLKDEVHEVIRTLSEQS